MSCAEILLETVSPATHGAPQRGLEGRGQGLGCLGGQVGGMRILAGSPPAAACLPLRVFSFPFQAVCPRLQSARCTTMTGLLKRKFDQLDEDNSSVSSSSSSSGCQSRSCSPSSSVSRAWDSEEEGPWDHMPLPDHDFCGPRSSTRESSLPREPPHLPSFLKDEI